jgi:hypothetical protein
VFPIKYSEPDYGNTSENDVIKLIENVVINGGSAKEANPAKHPNRDNIKHVFVEHI